MNRALALLVLGAACTIADRAAAQGAVPASGAALVTRMHDAYAGKWYRTLTFVQQTTTKAPDGAERKMTWYEALTAPDRLRIDVGEPTEGNGILYTSDSLYVVRGGKVVRSMAQGNPFLPIVAGIYLKPVDASLHDLEQWKIDMSRVRRDRWQGHPVFVVGARDAADLDSPQMWIDAERLIALRMLVPLVPNGKSKAQDIHLDNYVKVGGGWLATKIEMLDGGALMQGEEYTDWHADMPLDPRLFVAEQWSSVPHWKKP